MKKTEKCCWGEKTIKLTGLKTTEDDDWHRISIFVDSIWQESKKPKEGSTNEKWECSNIVQNWICKKIEENQVIIEIK